MTATTGTAAPNLPESALGGLGAQLGAGGQAKVFELPALTLPDVAGPLVYKRYKPGRAPAGGLAKIVGLRHRLDATARARLDAVAAWPVRQVLDAGGAVCGLVLPRIPDAFFHDVRAAGTGTVKRVPREVQYLFIPSDRAQLLGTADPTPQQRLTICRDFAGVLAMLHSELDVVFGDINAQNAVFRLSAEPTVMFVDCDAVRPRGDMAAAPQLNAPDWEPPEGSSPLGLYTDLYKLGLFVLRCVTPAAGSSVNRDPATARGVLDAAGQQMLWDALRGPAGARPSAAAWHRYLRRALGEVLAPPRLVRATLDRTFVAAGEPVTVTWTAADADTVEVRGVGIPPITVRGVAGSGTIAVRPTRTGTMTVTAGNALGEDGARIGPVGVFDVPAVHSLPVPLPHFELPQPSPSHLPEIGSVLPPFDGMPVLPPLPGVLPVAGGGLPSDPLDPAGPPPDLGFGPSTFPFDLTAIMSSAPGQESTP